jgi:hypothetical protein
VTRRRQDPWANDPIVGEPSSQAQQALPAAPAMRGVDGAANAPKPGSSPENPIEVGNVSQDALLKLAGDGAWVRYPDGRVEEASASVGSPEGAVGVAPGVTRSPWDADPVVTESQINADRRAQELMRSDALRSGGGAFYQGASLGFADEAAGILSGLGQAARNLGRRATGQDIQINSADLRDAVTRNVRGEANRFAQERPVENFALQAAGGLTTGGLVGGGRATVLNGARTGAIYGAGYGAGTAEGGFADRLPGAAVGGVVGGLTGGALQGGVNAASPYASRLMGIVGNTTRPAREAVGRTFNRGGPDPQVSAAQRLLRDVDQPAFIAERDRLTELGLNPSFADAAGGTTERTIRMAAGPAGPAAEIAVANAGARAANLKPEIMAVTRGLVDDPRSASTVQQALTQTRSTLADEMYPEAYAAPVEVTEDVLRALSDEPGRAALRRARAAAVARQNPMQVKEIDDLLRLSAGSGLPDTVPQRLPSGPLSVPDTPTPQQMQQFSRVERVPLAQARSSQNQMDWDRFARGDSPGDLIAGYGDKPVAVRLEDGQFLIYDGNHRTTRALQQGASDMEMYVIDAKTFAPDLAGRPAAPVNRQEIDDLLRELGVDPATTTRESGRPSVSAGTLDRVRIAMDGRAAAMQQRPDTRDIASGLFGRGRQIDSALEGVEALAPARSTYRNLSGAIDAIDNRPDVFTTDPSDFAAWVRDLTPEQRQAATVGVRQDILDTLGGQRNAGTGSIDRLAQSQYSRENLSALLGEQEAGQYIASVGARVAQAQRAARVSPNTNSQTFGRAMDEGNETASRVSALVDATGAFRGDIGGLARTIDRIRARATMTPQEREAIVQMGLGSADDLERIVQLSQTARQANRPPPREVRAYITNVRNTLGAQSPVVQQIETLLLPAPVSAEEQE